MTRGNVGGRRYASAAVAVAVLLTIIAPSAHAAVQRSPLDDQEELRGDLSQGRATTSIALARVELSNLQDRGELPAVLGRLVATADTTIRRPLSALQVTGVQADDRKAVEWQRHNGSANSVGVNDGPADLDRAGVKTKLDIGGWDATSPDREHALAELAVLQGQLDSNKIGVKGSLGERGLVSELSPTGALSRASVTLEGFDIDLAALLPVDMVGLPFGMSYRLSENLEVPLPDNVKAGVDAFASMLDQMNLIEDTLAVVDEAEARVAARAAEAPELADVTDEKELAEAAMAAALADLAGADTAVEDAEAMLAAATDAIITAEEAVVHAEALLAAAQGVYDDAREAHAQAHANVTVRADRLAQARADLDALQEQAANDPLQAIALAEDIAAREAEVAQAEADLAVAQAEEADAQTALDAAEAELEEAADVLAEAEAAVIVAVDTQAMRRAARDAARAALNSVQGVADAARERLATAQLAYEAATAAKADSDEELAALRADAQAMRAKLAVLFVELRGVLDAMPDLLMLQESLVDALEATPVLRVGAVHLTAEAEATAEGGRTYTDCRLSGIEVLGRPVPTMTCEDLADVREDIETRIEEFLSLVAGREVQGVLIDGPVATTRTTEVPDDRGFHSAQVNFTPLQVQIPTVDIAMTWDATHARLGEITDMLLERADLRTLPEFSDVPSVPLAEVPVLSLAVPTGGPIRVQSAGAWRIADEPQPLATELETLKEQADQTPPGAPVGGETPAVEAELGGLDNEAHFRTASDSGNGGGGCVGCGNGGNGGGGNGGNGGGGGGNGGQSLGGDDDVTGGTGGNGGGGNGGGGNGGGGANGGGANGGGANGGGANGGGANDGGANGGGANGGDANGGAANGGAADGGANGGGANNGGGAGSDGIAMPLPAGDLPHTGGGASAALGGLVLLLGGMVLRRRR